MARRSVRGAAELLCSAKVPAYVELGLGVVKDRSMPGHGSRTNRGTYHQAKATEMPEKVGAPVVHRAAVMRHLTCAAKVVTVHAK